MNLEERNVRQRDIIPQEYLEILSADIIGVGAIGRQVALQLAAIGVKNINLIDFDTVEIHNLAAQGFLEQDLGKSKVKAVENLCKQINSSINIISFDYEFSPQFFNDGIIFCCVDNIDTRKKIFHSIGRKSPLFLDARMNSEFIKILSVWDENSAEYYKNTLFDQSEAQSGRCTARTTIYTSNIAAGLMICQMVKYLKGNKNDLIQCLDFDLPGAIITKE